MAERKEERQAIADRLRELAGTIMLGTFDVNWKQISEKEEPPYVLEIYLYPRSMRWDARNDDFVEISRYRREARVRGSRKPQTGKPRIFSVRDFVENEPLESLREIEEYIKRDLETSGTDEQKKIYGLS